MRRTRMIGLIALVVALSTTAALFHDTLPARWTQPFAPPRDIVEIRDRVTPALARDLAQSGLTLGAPVYLRIFKSEAVLELWVQDADTYHLFRSYPICNYSGDLGPKLREGDRQSPEGFYTVAKPALNPNSSYHLSFNLGFPNRFDRAQGRTGSYLMVHGDCVSIGCYAMTNPAIEEIYLLVEEALNNGQPSVPVHAFPFRMTAENMSAQQGHRWAAFWQELRPAYTAFEQTRRVPAISVRNGTYAVTTP